MFQKFQSSESLCHSTIIEILKCPEKFKSTSFGLISLIKLPGINQEKSKFIWLNLLSARNMIIFCVYECEYSMYCRWAIFKSSS